MRDGRLQYCKKQSCGTQIHLRIEKVSAKNEPGRPIGLLSTDRLNRGSSVDAVQYSVLAHSSATI